MNNLNLTFAEICNENSTIKNALKIRKAKCNAIRKSRQREIILNIIITLVVVVLLAITCTKIFNTEPRYAIASETTINGNHFIYITERICEVTNVEEDYVTVSYNGNAYDFLGYGYEIGEQITCQFTDNMEIVGVVE